MDQDEAPTPTDEPQPDLISASPVAHVLLDASGALKWSNAAANALLGPALTRPDTLLLSSLGLQLAPTTDDAQYSPALTRWFAVQSSPAASGRVLIALVDAGAWASVRIARDRAQNLLDLARDVGRLGTWRRDVQSLDGEWDEQMFRIFGHDPSAGMPRFGDAEHLIAPEDRAAVHTMVERSRQALGTYDLRYRVVWPDGSQRRLHSQWRSLPGPDGRPEQLVGVVFDDTESWQLAQTQDEQASEMALAEQLIGLARWRHDLRSQRMHYSTQAYAVIGMAPRPDGLTIEEVRDLIHPGDLGRVMASAQQTLATGEPTDFDARYRGADGRWRDVMTRRALQRDENGNPIAFIGVSMDITARVAATRQAHDLASRLRLAARAAGIGYWSREPNAEQPHWNAQMRTLHGLGPTDEAPPLRPWLERFVIEADRPRVLDVFLRLTEQNQQHETVDFRIVDAHGQERDLMASSQIEETSAGTASFGIVVDVTERRRADQALHQASERAALAARGAGIGTWEIDAQTGHVLWDEQMWRLRGLKPQPQTSDLQTMLASVHPDDREGARSRHHAAGCPLPVSAEYRVLWPDGRVRLLASRSVPILDMHSEVVRRIGINWDITDTRQANNERRERELAERSSRAKSEFLSRMSHELRTPLNAVLGFAQLIQGDCDAKLNSAQSIHLQHIVGAGQHLLALINDVLDLTGVEAGQLSVVSEPVDLLAMVHEVVSLVSPLRESLGLADVVIGAFPTRPLADPTRLRQVLLNLLSNAVKYNRPGGQVSVESDARNGEVSIHVIDTGLGLTTAQMAHLFEPFNRLGNETPAIEGTGIGLTISKGLVEYMQGRIDVQSRPGQGSRFTVILPAADDSVDNADSAASSERSPTGPVVDTYAIRGTVLYIEDNDVNMLLVRELIARLGEVQLLSAIDGEAGLAAARAHRPDLVLLDMQLPDMDGMEVFRRLRADPVTAHLPCVAVSANAHLDDQQRARDAGFADYWTKPLDLSAFLDGMRALLAPSGGGAKR